MTGMDLILALETLEDIWKKYGFKKLTKKSDEEWVKEDFPWRIKKFIEKEWVKEDFNKIIESDIYKALFSEEKLDEKFHEMLNPFPHKNESKTIM